MRIDILLLFMILGRKSFTISMMCVDCGFFVDTLYQVKEVPFAEDFYHEWMLDFVKCFSCTCWDDCLFFLFYWYGILHWFRMLNQPCIPGLNPTWLWCIIFLNMFLDLVCEDLVEEFCIYIHRKYWSLVLFSCDVFVRFWYLGNTCCPIRFRGWENLFIVWICTAR